MSSDEYNGGTLVGMVGKDCVGIACDRRFGK
jgi:20S proteasome alpha/beta subunit